MRSRIGGLALTVFVLVGCNSDETVGSSTVPRSLAPEQTTTLPASSTTATLPATSSTVGESAGGFPDCHSEDREIPPDAKVPWVASPVERPAGVETVSVGGPPIDIAVGEKLVWVAVGATENSPARMVGVDPSTMERMVDVKLADASGVAVGGDVWVSQFWRDMLVRIDPTEREDPWFLPVPELPPNAALSGADNCFGPGSIAVGNEGVWFDGRGVLGLADPDTQRIDVLVPPGGEISKGGNVVVGFGYVWVDSGGSRVFRVDEERSSWAGPIEVGQHTGHVVSTMAVARDLLWVGGRNLERRSDGTIGNTLAEEGAGISTVGVGREAVIHTLSFDNGVTLASDGVDTVVAWEIGIGLWLLEGSDELQRRPILCAPIETWVLAATEDSAWVGVVAAGEVWQVDLEEAEAACDPTR